MVGEVTPNLKPTHWVTFADCSHYLREGQRWEADTTYIWCIFFISGTYLFIYIPSQKKQEEKYRVKLFSLVLDFQITNCIFPCRFPSLAWAVSPASWSSPTTEPTPTSSLRSWGPTMERTGAEASAGWVKRALIVPLTLTYFLWKATFHRQRCY